MNLHGEGKRQNDKNPKNRWILRPECISMKSCYRFFIYLIFFPGNGKRTGCICKIKSSLQIHRKTQTHRHTDTSSKRYQFGGDAAPVWGYSHNYIQIHINCDRNWKRDCNCSLDIHNFLADIFHFSSFPSFAANVNIYLVETEILVHVSEILKYFCYFYPHLLPHLNPCPHLTQPSVQIPFSLNPRSHQKKISWLLAE